MMPADENDDWPTKGEIDIMEMIGSDPDRVVSTIHFSQNQQHAKLSSSLNLTHDDFHVYAFEWDNNELRWYVDGVLYHKRAKSEWNADNGDAPFNKPFYMIMNLAVGGNWPGSPDENTDFSNQEMLVDYVRVYQ